MAILKSEKIKWEIRFDSCNGAPFQVRWNRKIRTILNNINTLLDGVQSIKIVDAGNWWFLGKKINMRMVSPKLETFPNAINKESRAG